MKTGRRIKMQRAILEMGHSVPSLEQSPAVQGLYTVYSIADECSRDGTDCPVPGTVWQPIKLHKSTLKIKLK